MSWSRGKPAKEYLVTPRPCTKCGQHMSEEFLREREQLRREKVSKALMGQRRKVAK